ncbi:MAG: DUF1997 domain-containing protein [Cyanobacteria bacterium P01_A01_bin.84]
MLSKNREGKSLGKTNSKPNKISIIYPSESNLYESQNNLDDKAATVAPNCFEGHYSDCMEMYAEASTVAKYLDSHELWFSRCAQPMKVEPLGKDGYALVIGRFGSFGYEVEPKIGLELLPQDAGGVYRIRTIAIPNYTPSGYDVDYRASLALLESTNPDLSNQEAPITRIEWELDLKVYVYFPRFIQKLPKSLIQSTGDKLLNQIVRQVSRRLTHKVQVDFHKSLGIPFDIKSKKKFN